MLYSNSHDFLGSGLKSHVNHLQFQRFLLACLPYEAMRFIHNQSVSFTLLRDIVTMNDVLVSQVQFAI